jgi:hypothetical protein
VILEDIMSTLQLSEQNTSDTAMQLQKYETCGDLPAAHTRRNSSRKLPTHTQPAHAAIHNDHSFFSLCTQFNIMG